MFVYEKKLEYPIRIKNSNTALAKFICSQYGGPDGELGASLRYLSQRYAMPYPELSAILTDIGTEELGHLEMVGTIVYQLTRSMTPEQIKQSGYDTYFVDHTAGVFPQFASGTPWTAATIGVTGDVIADLSEDMSAEQKAQYQLEQKERELAEREERLAVAENTAEALKVLADKGLRPGLVKYVVAADAETMMDNINELEKEFKASVKAEVVKRLAGSTPRRNLPPDQAVDKAAFGRMMVMQQQELYKQNPELYKQLTQ